MRFPGAVRSFPHPCGGRTVPKNREEARKRFAHQPNGVPCGVFLHTFLHRLWKSFALLCGKWERECGLAPALLAPPCRCCPRRGRTGGWLPADLAVPAPGGGLAFFVACLPCLQFIFFCPLSPLSPRPPSPAGKGETQSLFRRGLRPRHPGTEPLAALTEPVKKTPSGGRGGFGRRLTLPLWCLKGWLAFFTACLPCLQFIFLPPIPPPPFPGGEGGDQGYFMQGASPLASPGLNPGGTGAGGRISRWRGAAPPCRLASPPLSPAGGLPPRFSFHALTGAAGCDILVYRTEPPRRTARKQKETPYRTAIPKRRKGENRA